MDNVENKDSDIKWWQTLVAIILFMSIIFIVLSIIGATYKGYKERVYLREITIIKTRYEITRLKCGDRGGSFEPVTYLTLCNK